MTKKQPSTCEMGLERSLIKFSPPLRVDQKSKLDSWMNEKMQGGGFGKWAKALLSCLPISVMK